MYLLTSTTFQPTWGKIYQNFAVKRVFVLVVSIFMSGSLICAVAQNSPTFIAGRAIAGIGSGGVFSGGLTIIAHTVPLHRRPSFSGGLSALFGVVSLKCLLKYR